MPPSKGERAETGTATEQKPFPDLIVGIDLGTTFTGVSYCVPRPGKLDPPEVITNWPGNEGEVANKVPTMFSTGIEGDKTWGYQTLKLQTVGDNQSAMAQKYIEYFKLLLDKGQLDDLNRSFDKQRDEISMAKVASWFKEYLHQLYDWITRELGKIHQKELKDMRVDFLFSVPTMWDQGTKEDYLKIIKEAGFGGVENQMHTPRISLNEAEAAAIFVALCHPREAAHEFKEGDIVLICDAGGGTTDVSALKVVRFERKTPIFEQQSPVQGIPIGSMIIDEHFNDNIQTRLRRLRVQNPNVHVTYPSPALFQVIKASLGTGVAKTKAYSLPIPGLSKEFSDPENAVVAGSVVFSRSILEGYFERLLSGDSDSHSEVGPGSGQGGLDEGPNAGPKGIYGLIDKQIRKLARSEPPGRVDYLVLSGGLGSSKYIQRRLQERYGQGGIIPQKIEVIIADDPLVLPAPYPYSDWTISNGYINVFSSQLVVCRGLVMNRMRQLYRMKPIIRKRGCPTSYGLVWNEPFDKKKHADFKHEAIRMKPDNHRYLPNRIQWFLKQDELLDCESVLEFPFTQNIRYSNATTLTHKIVSCDQRMDRLPVKEERGLVKLVCTISGTLRDGKELRNAGEVQKEQKIKIPILGEIGKYLQVTYKVRVKVEDEGLKFNIVFSGEDLGRTGEVDTEWSKELSAYEAQPLDSGSEVEDSE